MAVDGPSGAGKSTVSKIVAKRLGLTYIDTGAMYRAIALKAKELGIDPGNSWELEKIAKKYRISFKMDGDRILTFLDGDDVSDRIREPEISALTSKVAAFPGVRRALVDLQREMGKDGGVIMDGRDVGTVVFPDSKFKFFLDASLDVRGKRRYLELSAQKGAAIDEDSTVKDMAERDRIDSLRAESPLKKAEDALYIDTTGMTPCEVADRMEAVVASRPGRE